jgi:Lsr2.
MSTINKVSITIHTDEVTPRGIQNAVRRALTNVSDLPAKGAVSLKDITVTIRPVKEVPFKSKQDIRVWAAQNGHPEVVGKRGRLPRAVLDAFALANA